MVQIDMAGPEEIEMILDAVLERMRILHPETEIKCLSLPFENWSERVRILEQMLQFEKACEACFRGF